jgi:L-malate glycosyltransferase
VNHTAITSGGEQSLIDLVLGLPNDVSALVACPEGELAERLRDGKVRVERIPAIDASLRLHPVHSPRGAAQIVRSALAVRRAARSQDADLIHANSVRAGLAAVTASRLGGPPVIVHVRDCLPPTSAAAMTRRFIAAGATTVLANSRHTAANFRLDGSDRKVQVVYSPVDRKRFDPDRIDRGDARARLGVDPEKPLLGMVGQITPWKDQATAIEAFALLRDRMPGAQLLIAGSVKFSSSATRYDNAGYLESLRQMVAELGLDDQVMFLGERQDVPETLRALDLLLVPSWEEPFGRTVVEAMAMGTPVIATSIGGPAEVIEDRVNGRLLPPQQPRLWARAIEELIADPKLRETMAAHGFHTAVRFDRTAHVDRVLEAYRDTLASRASG